MFGKTEAGKSYHDYRNIIVFEKRLLEMLSAKTVFSNSSSLKSVFEKFRFRDGFGVDGRPKRRNIASFQILLCGVEYH